MWQRGMCGRGNMHGGGHVWWGACMARACMAGGGCMAGKMAIPAVGTYPTGMHSCFELTTALGKRITKDFPFN